MGKLSESLKLILEGLAYQDAADYLSTEEKLEVLGIEPLTKTAISIDVPGRGSGPGETGRRIALISGGESEAPALDFALSACRRHNAELDLVSLAALPAEETGLQQLSSRAASRTDIQVSRVHLPLGRPDALRDYISSHPSLIYLVAAVADDLAERILRTVGRQVPLVLVRSHPPLKSSSVYAA